MFKNLLPFILLAIAIILCIGIVWFMDKNRYLPFLKIVGLNAPSIISPLGSSSTMAPISQTPYVMSKSFTESDMNIRFSYPEDLQVEKKNDSLLWVHTNTTKEEKDSILIYVTKVAKATATTDVTVPFKIDGDISQNVVIKKSGYNARLVTFTSGAVSTQVFFFRSDTQAIIAKIPQESALSPDISYAVLQTIQKVK